MRLSGETEPRKVNLLAADRGNDLALLRMSGDGFEAATFADPGSVRASATKCWRSASPSASTATPSVTLGIVSALDRTIAQSMSTSTG